MGLIDTLGRSLDKTIGVFSPQSEVDRTLARLQRQSIRERQYAAAKTSRATGDWIPVNQDVNSTIRTSAAMIRARARQLVRDFPIFKRAVDILTDFTVGTGIKFQSRVKNSDGSFDKESIQKIESAIKWWMDEADAAGKLHYFEVDRLAKRQDVESGEFLLVKKFLTARESRGRFIPFTLQAFESDWLTNLTVRAQGNNQIDQGIEYDPATGRPIAYNFQVPTGFGSIQVGGTKTVRIPADSVIHGFQTLRPGQLRGISPFTTAVLAARDLSDYLDTEVDGAKMAAKWVAFIETGDMGGMQIGRTKAGTGVDAGKKIEEMENGLLEYLGIGEKITLASHNRPGDSFPTFVQVILRMLAVGTGTTYELLTSDYKGINYSTSRTIRNDFAKALAPQTMRHARDFSRSAIFSAMDAAVLAGKLDLPGYFKNRRHYQESVFIGPGMELLDPFKESKANEAQMTSGLMSPQEITAKRGRDYEEVLDELKAAKKMTEERGLIWQPNSKVTGIQQNPAKLEASENAAN